MKKPLLSVVATSRNDDHGKNLLYRMQTFVDGFIEQCKRHNLNAELVLVEWNPLDHKLPLSQALKFPKDKGPCTVRIIRVPNAVHAQLQHSDKLPLFQMIGKNVGIRRARGKFVLATNIDILFSDALMRYLKRHLKSKRLYRADRLDVPEQLPENVPFDKVLQFCSENILRVNAKFGTILPVERSSTKLFLEELSHYFHILYQDFSKKLLIVRERVLRELAYIYQKLSQSTPKISWVYRFFTRYVIRFFIIGVKTSFKTIRSLLNIFQSISILIYRKMKSLIKKKFFSHSSLIPHTNACGDFTLLSYNDWHRLRGYPEWNQYSWHIDSVLVHQARHHGIKEVDLPRSRAIYHIEHEAGSGFSPEHAHLLFKRLNDKKIPYLTDADLDALILQMKQSDQKTVYNDTDWGMSAIALEEVVIGTP